MKRLDLFHPRVFNEPVWAEGYYKRNRKSIARVGKRLARLILSRGFTQGNLLDVGCGFASVPIAIARAIPGMKITGIDLGDPLLDLGRKLVREEGLDQRITLLKGDAHHLPFADKSYDVVINSFLLHIVEDPARTLNEMERVVKTDGLILITDLRRGFLAHFVRKFRTAYTLEEAEAVIHASGIRKGRITSGLFWWDYLSDRLATSQIDT